MTLHNRMPFKCFFVTSGNQPNGTIWCSTVVLAHSNFCTCHLCGLEATREAFFFIYLEHRLVFAISYHSMTLFCANCWSNGHYVYYWQMLYVAMILLYTAWTLFFPCGKRTYIKGRLQRFSFPHPNPHRWSENSWGPIFYTFSSSALSPTAPPSKCQTGFQLLVIPCFRLICPIFIILMCRHRRGPKICRTTFAWCCCSLRQCYQQDQRI